MTGGGDEFAAGRLVAKARALIDAGNLDGGIVELKAALAIDPDDAFAQSLLAACFLDKGDLKAARSEAEAVLSRAPEALLAQQIVGLAHLGAQDFPAAEDAFRRAAEIDPSSAESFRLLGALYDAQARFVEAREAFDEALRLEPDNGAVLASYADFLVDKGEVEAASELADRAPDWLSDDARLLVVRGKIALRRGDLERARDFALWVLGEDAQNRAAINLLCQAKAKKNPLMALWLSWATWLQTLDGKTRVAVVLGLWLGYNVLSRTAMRSWPETVQLGVAVVWLALCLLTWIGPAVLGWMVQRELKAIRLRKNF